MSLEKVLKKILSVTLAVAFVLQQGGLAFAATDVSTWADLQAGIAGTPGEYNVTTALTADDSPAGTLSVTADGYSVTGASLTENGTHDTLINVAGTVTGFDLANDIIGSIINDGVLNYTGSSLSGGTITGGGSIYFKGTTTNDNAITQANISVKSGATLTNNALLTGAISTEAGGTLLTDPDNLGGDVANKGIVKLNADGTLAVAITDSDGKTEIRGNVVVDDSTGSISQDTIKIGTGYQLTANANNLTAATEIFNDGSLEITGGTNANAINGDGDVTFSGTGTITNNGAIDQQTGGVVNDSSYLHNNALITAEITNNLNKNLTSLADNLNGKVHNNGVLSLTGNATQDAIDGTGNLFIYGDTTNAYNVDQVWLDAYGADFGNSGIVSVQNLKTDATGSVTNTNNISVTHDVINAGAIDNQAGAMFDNSASTGVINNNGGSITNAGTFNAYTINNNAGGYVSNSGSLSFNNVDNASGAMFYQDAGSMNTTGTTATFDNSGTFMLDGGDAYVASLTNRAGADVTLNGGQLTAETLLNKSDIYNDATLNTVNFTNDGAVTGSGTTNITGDSTNNGSITQGLVAISNNSTFTNNGMLLAKVTNEAGSTVDSDPDNLGGDVVNDGTLNLNAAGTLTVDVTGAGETNIGGDLTNNGSISQKDVNVASGVAVTTNASDITATNVIDNSGIINYTGGTTGNTITGTGRIDITGYVTNTGDITQNTVSNSGVFTNNGTVTANLKNTNDIEGTGDIITGTGFSTNSGTIEQASITNNGTFDNNGHIALTGTLTNNSTFTTNADLLAAAGGVVNDSALNITGGANTNVITGGGTTFFTNTVTNNAAITQALVNNSGNLTNNALITSDIVNSGTLRTDGGNIVGDVDNSGSYVLTGGDIAGAITGTGTTSIFGNTTNNGNITQEKVTVGNSANFITASDTITAAIENQGTMLWDGGSSNGNVVTGNGGLVVTGTDILNTASISQDQITVTGTASLTTDASLLAATNGVTNNGDLVFLDGTNNNTVFGVGDLSIQGNVTNNAAVEQNSIYVGLGQLTTNADLLATTSGITNDADLILTGGTNANDISGTGTTTIDGTVTNGADISTDILVSATGNLSTLTDITSTVENRNVVQLIDADITSTGKIKGSGTTNILGDTVNSGTIDSSAVNIAAGASLTTDSDKVTGAISNEGDLTWTAGTGNANAITGQGSLEITGGDITNTASISQGNITITGGSLTSDANLLASASGITNNATFGLTGGTNTNNITGTGDLITTNDVTNQAAITQATVTNSGTLTNAGTITADVTNTGVLISDGDLITGDITNNGTYAITDGDNANDIIGTGDLQIQGTTTNTGAVSQDNINVLSGATFVASNIGDIATTTGIDNAGTFEMQYGSNTNVITGNTGALKVTGAVTNTSGVSINQDTLEIATLGSFTVDAGDITTVDGITNSGALIFGDGATANNISGNGTLTVNGTVTNSGNISQKSLTNTGDFTSDASLLAFANGIANSNTLTLTGGTNDNAITGAGTTNFTGDATNNGTINQSSVSNTATLTNNAAITASSVVNSGTINNEAAITGPITNTGTINSTADNLVGVVTNNNTLNLAGGEVQNTINGSGNTVITDDLVNSQNIIQATVTNNANMTNSGAITADFTNNGDVDNSADITGAITNNGNLTSAADHLVGAVANSGTLNVEGGTMQDVVTGTGTMNIITDLTSGYAITQDTVTNDGVFTNNATVTATTISNTGTIIGKASDLVASSGIDNDGTLVFNAASTGASDISGDGDVQVTADTTLTGSNSFTGGTLIDGATLTVAGASNLSSGDVSFANSGILDVTAAATLDNVLKGDAATDDITVNHAGALTLNTATGVANDFHKTGAGTMTFAMTSNGYTGNTYVDGGTLIGNTQNINNTVNGAAGTTVEFNDTADADLNAINTLGTFVQSGSAVLNVKNNAFTAAQADINAGTFAANRALTATVLNVNSGATLRGNGNITGTVNVNGGGTIAPGNSIDTLTVTGDLNLASGSTTAIEINETPASDKIIVTGATNIAGGANLTVSNENGRYFEWESFDILESAGNVTGTFTYDGTITDYDASRIEVGVDYSDPTKVVLTAKRKATDYAGTTGGLPRNASEAAHAMDAVSTGFGGDITNPLLQLEKLGGLNPTGVTLINPEATLLSALNDIHGVLYANSALATLFNAKTAHVYDRIAKRNPSAGKCTTCHDNVWVEYYSQYDKAYADANSPRFTNNMTGVLVGYDRSSDEALLGVYAGFGKSDLRERGGRMDIEDASLGVYGGYMTGDWLFKGTLFGGIQHYHGKRTISFMGRNAEGVYDGMNLGLDLEGSYNIPVYSWLNVKPFVGWLNHYSHQQAFAETGADSLNLHVSGNDQFNSQARLGVQFDGKVKNRLSWYASMAVKQFVGDDYAKLHMNLGLNNTDMDIISAELGRTYFSGQVGVNYALNNNWSIFGNLDTGLSNKSTNCYGNIGVAYTW